MKNKTTLTESDKKIKDDRANYYTTMSNSAAQSYNAASDKLSGILITASLAYMAIITAMLSDPDAISKIPTRQRCIIFLGILSFLTSILAGIVECMTIMTFFRRIHQLASELVQSLDHAKSRNDLTKIQTSKIKKLKRDSNRKSSLIPLTLQIVFFALGVSSTLYYIYIALEIPFPTQR